MTALLDRDAAAVVTDGDELVAFVRNCLLNPTEAQARGQRAASLVREQLAQPSEHSNLFARWFALPM